MVAAVRPRCDARRGYSPFAPTSHLPEAPLRPAAFPIAEDRAGRPHTIGPQRDADYFFMICAETVALYERPAPAPVRPPPSTMMFSGLPDVAPGCARLGQPSILNPIFIVTWKWPTPLTTWPRISSDLEPVRLRSVWRPARSRYAPLAGCFLGGCPHHLDYLVRGVAHNQPPLRYVRLSRKGRPMGPPLGF